MRSVTLLFLKASAFFWAIVGLWTVRSPRHHVEHLWPVADTHFLPVFAALMGWAFLGFALVGVVVWLVRGEQDD